MRAVQIQGRRPEVKETALTLEKTEGPGAGSWKAYIRNLSKSGCMIFYVHVRLCIEQAPHVFVRRNRNTSKCSVKYAGVTRRTVGKNGPPSLMPRFSKVVRRTLVIGSSMSAARDIARSRRTSTLSCRALESSCETRRSRYKGVFTRLGEWGGRGACFVFTISAPDIGESFTASETRGSRIVTEGANGDPTINGLVPCLPRGGL